MIGSVNPPELLSARARRQLPAGRQLLAWLGSQGMSLVDLSERLAREGESARGVHTRLHRLLAGDRPENELRVRLEDLTGIPSEHWSNQP